MAGRPVGCGGVRDDPVRIVLTVVAVVAVQDRRQINRSGNCRPAPQVAGVCPQVAGMRTPATATRCGRTRCSSGRAPESGRDLCSQPTMTRLENAPSRIEMARRTAALVDIFCRSFPIPPATITLVVDDTCDPVHDHQLRRGNQPEMSGCAAPRPAQTRCAASTRATSSPRAKARPTASMMGSTAPAVMPRSRHCQERQQPAFAVLGPVGPFR